MDSDAIRHRMSVQAFQAAATDAQRAARKAAKIAEKGKLDPTEMEESIVDAIEAWKAVMRPIEED